MLFCNNIEDFERLVGSNQVEKISNNNGIGSAISKPSSHFHLKHCMNIAKYFYSANAAVQLNKV
mgnify:CR=1 FL=1